MKKEIKELMKYAEEIGWVYIRRTSDGHYLMRHSVTGHQHPIPSTPSDKRGLKNCKTSLTNLADPNHPGRTLRR